MAAAAAAGGPLPPQCAPHAAVLRIVSCAVLACGMRSAHSAAGVPRHPCCVPSLPLLSFPISLPSLCSRQVTDLLCISDAEATRVLRHYKWDLGKLQVGGWVLLRAGGACSRSRQPPAARSSGWLAGHAGACRPGCACCARCAAPQEEWFGDPDRVRAKVGLIDEQPSTRCKEVGGHTRRGRAGRALRRAAPARAAAGHALFLSHTHTCLPHVLRLHQPCMLCLPQPTAAPAGDVQDLFRGIPCGRHGLRPLQALLLQGGFWRYRFKVVVGAARQ